MVVRVKQLVADWPYGVVSIGYPGPVLHGSPISEPHNLGTGWVGFDFVQAFGCPVKIVNDAALQALGCHEGGKMLILGIGTGLGSAMIVEGIVEPMELAHLPYKKGTYEDYVGRAGLERDGKKKWRQRVASAKAFVGGFRLWAAAKEFSANQPSHRTDAVRQSGGHRAAPEERT